MIHNFDININLNQSLVIIVHMSIEEKQNYLRTEIIERNINTQDFFQYWQTLNLQLEEVDMQTLTQVVSTFISQIDTTQYSLENNSEEQHQTEESVGDIDKQDIKQDRAKEGKHTNRTQNIDEYHQQPYQLGRIQQKNQIEVNHQEDEEDQFTDFQEAEAEPAKELTPDKKQANNDYSDFNWDFLNSKKTKDHQLLAQTSLVSNDSPQKPLITPQKKIEPLKKVEVSRKKQQVKKIETNRPQQNKQNIVSNKMEKKDKVKTDVTLKPQKNNTTLIDELDQGTIDKPTLCPESRPCDEKSITVNDVLRQSRSTRLKCLKLQQNVLSHHTNVQIVITKVQEVEEKNQNILSKLVRKSQLVFTVKTVARNKNRSIGISWEVKRRSRDFEWLRNTLVKFYPGIVVPPLPPPTSSKEKIYGYQKKLQHFLLDCYRCPQLRNSTYYENFLSYSNPQDFDNSVKNSLNASKPRSINHIINMTGYIDTLFSQNLQQYGEGLQNYINKTTNHLKQVNQILNDINQAYDTISDSYKELASVFFQMSDQSHTFSDQKCYERLTKTYKQVAILTEEHSTFCQIEKDFIDAFMKSHFSYEKIRLENMQGLINKRNTFAAELAKRPKDEAKGMFSKLGSLFGEKTETVDSPSSNYQSLQNQVGFYNRQLIQESVRCIQVMIESHINHFAGYGHSRVDNVDNMQKIWSNQLVELSKLSFVS